jgi:hypothetical protein
LGGGGGIGSGFGAVAGVQEGRHLVGVGGEGVHGLVHSAQRLFSTGWQKATGVSTASPGDGALPPGPAWSIAIAAGLAVGGMA